MLNTYYEVYIIIVCYRINLWPLGVIEVDLLIISSLVKGATFMFYSCYVSYVY